MINRFIKSSECTRVGSQRDLKCVLNESPEMNKSGFMPISVHTGRGWGQEIFLKMNQMNLTSGNMFHNSNFGDSKPSASPICHIHYHNIDIFTSGCL